MRGQDSSLEPTRELNTESRFFRDNKNSNSGFDSANVRGTMTQRNSILIVLGILAIIVVVGVLTYFFTHKNAPTQALGCDAFPNNSVQDVIETQRLFINLPRNSYLVNDSGSDENFHFVTASGTATALYISNGGPWGESMHATPECWSTYFEFDGSGEVDLRVKSALKNMPDYMVRFIVRGQ